MAAASPSAVPAIPTATDRLPPLAVDVCAREAQREAIHKLSSGASRLAKQALFALHKGDASSAERHTQLAEDQLREALPLVGQDPTLRHCGFSSAVEELGCVMVFKAYLRDNRLLRSTEMPLADTEEYLCAVLDFTVEVGRYAIQQATARNRGAVQRCRDTVEAIQGQLMQFDFRNSMLRRKYDGLKYGVRKLETTLYELTLAEAIAQGKQPGTTQVQP